MSAPGLLAQLACALFGCKLEAASVSVGGSNTAVCLRCSRCGVEIWTRAGWEATRTAGVSMADRELLLEATK